MLKKIMKQTLELFFILFFILCSTSLVFLSKLYTKNNQVEVTPLVNNKISKVIDNNGNSVLEMELTKNNSVTFNQLPDVFINALISGEDARFFSHQGIDLQRIISSLAINISEGKLQGASTLTQQLIKNTLLDSSKTLDRKLKEIILALHLEDQLTKEEILEA